MDNSMLDVITRVLQDYGEEMLSNMQRANAILLDLAPEMRRERILVRSFVEMDGLAVLKDAQSYPLAERKLVQGLVEAFSMERAAALWVVRLFGAALGYIAQERNERAASVSFSFLNQVAIGKKHVAAISSDGTVFAGGDNIDYQCDVSGWRDIVAVAAGDAHTLGLRADGKVLATGSNVFDECDIGHLTNVRGVYAYGHDSVCVFKDGTALAFGRSKLNLSNFTDIVGIARYPEGIIGIKSDGRLDLAGFITEDDAAAEIAWLLGCTDVEQVISTYRNGSIVLGRDKRIYKSNQPENYFAQWRGVVSLVDLADCFAILREDGTVRVLPYERTASRPDTEADTWQNIAAIYGGYKRLIGLTKDGSLKVAYTHQGWLWGNKAMAMDYVLNWYPVGVCDFDIGGSLGHGPVK